MRLTILPLLLACLLSGCVALPSMQPAPPTQPVTLTQAIEEVTKALSQIAASSEPRHGLLPDEVTVELAIAVAEGNQTTAGMTVTAGTFLAELPEISSSQVRSTTTNSGNKITIKFKNVALAPTLRTKREVDQLKIDWKDYLLRMPSSNVTGQRQTDPSEDLVASKDVAGAETNR